MSGEVTNLAQARPSWPGQSSALPNLARGASSVLTLAQARPNEVDPCQGEANPRRCSPMATAIGKKKREIKKKERKKIKKNY